MNMLRPFEIRRPDQHTLRIDKSRVLSLLTLLGFAAFFCLWYGMLLYGNHPTTVASGPVTRMLAFTQGRPFLWLFILSPLISLPFIVTPLKIAAVGENFVFDRTDRLVFRDGKALTPFDGVQKITVGKISGNDSPDLYTLSLVCTTGKKIRIEKSKDAQLIAQAADALAEVLAVRVEHL